MNNPKLRSQMARALGVLVVAVALHSLAGCGGGAEAQKPLPPPDPKAVPAGGSVQDYQNHMQNNAKNMGK